MNADELLRKKIARAEKKVSILDTMIEEKTRELYFTEQEFKRQNSFLALIVDTLPNSFLAIDAVGYESETRVTAIFDAQPTVSQCGGSGEMRS